MDRTIQQIRQDALRDIALGGGRLLYHMTVGFGHSALLTRHLLPDTPILPAAPPEQHDHIADRALINFNRALHQAEGGVRALLRTLRKDAPPDDPAP